MVSHSIKNLQRTNTYFEARIQTVAGLMQERLGLREVVARPRHDAQAVERPCLAAPVSGGRQPGV